MHPRGDLRELLHRPPAVLGGTVRYRWPLDRIDLRGEVARIVKARGFTSSAGPLETLHRRVNPAYQGWGPFSKLSLDDPCVQWKGFEEAYLALARFLASDVFRYDLYVEAAPKLRFHFPGSAPDRYRSRTGHLLGHHVDTFFNDHFEQVNVWVPLTTCFGTNTIQLTTLTQSLEALDAFGATFDYDLDVWGHEGRNRFYLWLRDNPAWEERVLAACQPADAQFGELLLFDGRCIHATAENRDDHTRVSIDFRVLAVTDFESIAARYAAAGRPLPVGTADGRALAPGGFYRAESAFSAR